MGQRLDRISSILVDKHLDALILTNESNVSYISGFDKGEAVLLIIPGKTNLIITDPRFIQEVSFIKGFISEITSEGIPKVLASKFKEFSLKKVAFEALTLTYSQHLLLKEAASGIELVAMHGLIEEMRSVKEECEIAKIKEAIEIATLAFEALLKELKPGMTEKMIADRLDSLLRQKGAYRAAFDIIVASGNNTSRPHAKPTERTWQAEELLLIDWGAYFKGYNCDLTRVVLSDRINTDKKKIYKILLEAQEKVIASIKPGIKAKEIEAFARNFLKDNNLDRLFLHNLGHGIGMDVHECPQISENSEVELEENMVITVEPAVYFPEGIGMRIEDMVVVTKDGCEVLSHNLRQQYFYD